MLLFASETVLKVGYMFPHSRCHDQQSHCYCRGCVTRCRVHFLYFIYSRSFVSILGSAGRESSRAVRGRFIILTNIFLLSQHQPYPHLPPPTPVSSLLLEIMDSVLEKSWKLPNITLQGCIIWPNTHSAISCLKKSPKDLPKCCLENRHELSNHRNKNN